MDMTGTGREHCGENVAPYALGALPAGEARDFERHLASCALCQADLEELRPALEALPEAAEPVEPPPELRRRILAAAEREAAARHGAERRPQRRRRSLPALAAAAVLLLAGLGIGLVVGGDGTQTYSGTVASAGAGAELRVTDDHGRLVVHGMPNPPRDRVWQVWLEREGVAAPQPTDALFTTSRDGSASVDVPGDLDDVTRVLVTHEPRGGSTEPTAAPAIEIALS